MKKIILYFMLSNILLLNLTASDSDGIVIDVNMNKVFYKQYVNLLNNRKCENVHNYNSKYSHRVTIEALILCKAIKESGLNAKINFISIDHFSRSLKNIKEGNQNMPAQSRWKSGINTDDFYISDPIVRNGEFIKGIFTRADNTSIFKVSSLKELRNYTLVTSSKWKVDFQTIKKLKLPYIDSPGKIDIMYALVDRKRADYHLGEFRSLDLEYNEINGIKLYPVKNLSVQLEGSRHFIVSRKSKNSKIIFDALQKGIKILREKNIIEKAYYDSGFYNKKASKWKRISVSSVEIN